MVDPAGASTFYLPDHIRYGFERVLLEQAVYVIGHSVDDPGFAAGFLKFVMEEQMHRLFDGWGQPWSIVAGGPDRMDPDPGE